MVVQKNGYIYFAVKMGGCVNEVKTSRCRTGVFVGKCQECKNKKKPFESVYNKLASNSRHRGIDFSLSYEDYLEFTKIKNCVYCFERIDWDTHSRYKGRIMASYLDRKNSGVGYSKDNLVVCCPTCNKVKNNIFTHDEFIEYIAPGLRQLRIERENAKNPSVN